MLIRPPVRDSTVENVSTLLVYVLDVGFRKKRQDSIVFPFDGLYRATCVLERADTMKESSLAGIRSLSQESYSTTEFMLTLLT